MALQTMIIMNVPSMMHLTIGGFKMKMWWKCDENVITFTNGNEEVVNSFKLQVK
jgi:hypothetical protein